MALLGTRAGCAGSPQDLASFAEALCTWVWAIPLRYESPLCSVLSAAEEGRLEWLLRADLWRDAKLWLFRSILTYLCRPWCEVLFMSDIPSGVSTGCSVNEYTVQPTKVHDEKCHLELTEMAAKIYHEVVSTLPDLLIQDCVPCLQWNLDLSTSTVSAADAAL